MERKLNVKMKVSKKNYQLGVEIPNRFFFLDFYRWQKTSDMVKCILG